MAALSAMKAKNLIMIMRALAGLAFVLTVVDICRILTSYLIISLSVMIQFTAQKKTLAVIGKVLVVVNGLMNLAKLS